MYVATSARTGVAQSTSGSYKCMKLVVNFWTKTYLAERAIKQLPLLILNKEIQRLFLLDNLDYKWPQEKNDKSVGLDSTDKIGIRTEEQFQL